MKLCLSLQEAKNEIKKVQLLRFIIHTKDLYTAPWFYDDSHSDSSFTDKRQVISGVQNFYKNPYY